MKYKKKETVYLDPDRDIQEQLDEMIIDEQTPYDEMEQIDGEKVLTKIKFKKGKDNGRK